MSAFGGARGFQPKPPEKGVFPLDHFGECSREMQGYLDCLKAEGQDANKCQQLSRLYLECRMQRDLMAEQDLDEVGLDFVAKEGTSNSNVQEPESSRSKAAKGFVAGSR
ncbi:hypothetical protein BSKO_14052 [Bryopsis sp. KO-2023]|nr:hypothetical protein BSKO_14052 [Bryopsis sp. KO-2023]